MALGAKILPANAKDVRNKGSIPGSGRSPREDPLQYSCLEKSMDRGAWWAVVPGVTESQTQLSDQHFHFTSLCNPPIHPKSSSDYL